MTRRLSPSSEVGMSDLSAAYTRALAWARDTEGGAVRKAIVLGVRKAVFEMATNFPQMERHAILSLIEASREEDE